MMKNAHVTATLDESPFYDWTGPIDSLRQRWYWISPTGVLGIGAYASNWVVEEVVEEVKAKRLAE